MLPKEFQKNGNKSPMKGLFTLLILGSMMKKQNLHMWSLSLLMLAYGLSLAIGVPASTASTLNLRDIANSYAVSQIRSLNDAGIISGDEHGYFHPTRLVTRAEFVAMLNRTIGIKPVASNTASYTDVPKSSWAYGDIQAAAALELVNGTSSRTFSPVRTITREEAAAMLVRALKEKSVTNASLSLKDVQAISTWALPSVRDAVHSGWLTGYNGYFRPKDALSREETAVILYRIHNLLKSHPVSAKPLVSLGWQYQTTTAEFINQVKNSSVNTLSPRWFFLQKDGSISDTTDASLVTWAKKNGKQVWPLFGNRFDSATTHAVLTDPAKRKALVQTLTGYVQKYQLDGVNVDFESFSPSDRDFFTLFIKELTAALHQKGAVVSVDVPPDTGSDWSDPFDYGKLAEYADYIVLMAYEEHWVGSQMAGSVASLPWFKNTIANLLDEVPSERLIVGMPLYTRDWYKAQGGMQSTDLSIPDSYGLLSRYGGSTKWDANLGQYVSYYNKGGVTHTIWLEESRSLGLKAKASLEYHVGGFAYWYIGSESPDVWSAINNSILLKQTRKRL